MTTAKWSSFSDVGAPTSGDTFVGVHAGENVQFDASSLASLTAFATAPTTGTAGFPFPINLGTAYQNPNAYDILAHLTLLITDAAPPNVVTLGVGPTSTPTAHQLLNNVTSSLTYIAYSIYLPANYYLLLDTVAYPTGSITASITGGLYQPV